jgi:hypothetical protein
MQYSYNHLILIFLFHISSLQIPHSLYKDDGYAHREALFGYPPYGGSIAQQVYYADSQLCDVNVDTTKGFPEREKENGVMKPWPSPYILMVDRGDCTFVQKVRTYAMFYVGCKNLLYYGLCAVHCF